METDDRAGTASSFGHATRRHSGRRQREHVVTLQGERSVRAAIGDTTARTSIITNADIGPHTITRLKAAWRVRRAQGRLSFIVDGPAAAGRISSSG